MTVSLNFQQILALVNALSAYIPIAELTVEKVIGALRGAGVAITDDAADADMRQLIQDAITAKQQSDAAAAGEDPQ